MYQMWLACYRFGNQHGKIKAGSYINDAWTCNDCIATGQAQKKKEEEQQDTIGVASKSDVSPNTPRADEAGL